MTDKMCGKQDNSAEPTVKRRLVCHVVAIFGFLVTVFSMSFAVNNGGVERIVRHIKEGKLSCGHSDDAKFALTPGTDTSETTAGEDTEKARVGLMLGITHKLRDFSKGLNFMNVEAVKSRGTDYSMVLPSSLSPVNDGGQVASQIIDHSLSSFFKAEAERGSFIGRTANAVEKKMRADVDFGGETPESTKHNLKFQVLASQTKASMEYKGITNAELSYFVGSRKTEFEVYEPISDDTKLVYLHSDKPDERRDMLSLRMNW